MHLSRAIILVVLGLLVAVTVQAQIIIGIDPSVHAITPPLPAPVVHNRTFQLSIPINTDFTVGTPTVDNSPLTSCIITTGNSGGNYAINNTTCAITVTNPTGKANLIAMGTDTLTVQATNVSGTGTGTMTINKWLDGATFAACTTPQYPGLLNTFNTRPLWKVAGVDYCVGPATGTVFKDPATIATVLGSAVTLACGGDPTRICVNTNGTVIDGWDFSLGTSGYWLDVNADNVTVTNNKFATAGNPQVFHTLNAVHNLTFKYNLVDGTGMTGSNPLFSVACGGTNVTTQYNWIHQTPVDLINYCSGTLNTQFNVLENSGATAGGTPDVIQEAGVTGGTLTSVANFNFVRQQNIQRTANGLEFTPNPATYAGANQRQYNTIIADGTNVVLNNGAGPSDSTGFTRTGTFTVSNNYGAYINTASGVFFHCGTATFTTYSANVNMVNGAAIAAPVACPGNAPVVTAQTFSIPATSPIGTQVGQITATNGPTNFSIVSCTPGCTGFFSLPTPTSNQIQTAVTFTNVAATYTLTVRADNAFGFGQANETINVTPVAQPGAPVVSAQTFTISTPASIGDFVGVASATNLPTQWTVSSCPSCSGFFTIANDGTITVSSAGEAGMTGSVDKLVLHPALVATNANGPSAAVAQTVNAYADGSAGGPGTAAQFPDLLGDRHVTAVALNQTGAGYQNGDIVQAYGVGTGTASGTCSSWPKWQVTHAGTTGRILADGLTLISSGTCSQTPTVQVPLICINCQGTQASVNITWSTNTITYATRPPWKVAGVDYGVGPHTGTVFKIPGVNTPPACVFVNGTEWQMNGTDCTVDGWDFTGNHGTLLVIDGNTINPIIRNNKFKLGPGCGGRVISILGINNGVANGNDGIVEFNDIDGNACSDNDLAFERGGINTVRYNYIHNSGTDLMTGGSNFGNDGPSTTWNIRYNLFHNMGQDINAGHSDFWQGGSEGPASGGGCSSHSSSYCLYNSITMNFNTQLQNAFPDPDPTQAGGQGFVLDMNNHGYANTPLITFNYNVGISKNIALCQLTYVASFNQAFGNGGTFTVNENYIDPSGICSRPALQTSFGPSNCGDPGPFCPGPSGNATVVSSGNKSLLTGGNCAYGTGSPC